MSNVTYVEQKKEDLEHFLLWCPAYTVVRVAASDLQQPYIENTENIIGHFLFEQQDMDIKIDMI